MISLNVDHPTTPTLFFSQTSLTLVPSIFPGLCVFSSNLRSTKSNSSFSSGPKPLCKYPDFWSMNGTTIYPINEARENWIHFRFLHLPTQLILQSRVSLSFMRRVTPPQLRPSSTAWIITLVSFYLSLTWISLIPPPPPTRSLDFRVIISNIKNLLKCLH